MLDRLLHYAWYRLFNFKLILFRHVRYNSLLCLHDVLMPKVIQLLSSLLFLLVTFFVGSWNK